MELKGPGFLLRGWKIGDEFALQKHADNKNISSYLLDRFPSPYKIEDAKSWVELMINQQPQTNFAIDIAGEVVGVIGLDMRTDVYRKTPLIGYWLSEEYWGKGIMPEAVKLIVNYGFSNLDIIRIQAGVLGNNLKSMRVMEKAGFVKEGILKNAIVKNGEILDEHIFGICKD